ncbi:acyltransferase family protein [Sphingomonas sp. SAFR-052]|uniref:acyltransferase family protein n=1 Tax=Sphingomonas sp. SAFR-052 TaxID=3436867 RepID=UPI003F7E7167
MDFLRGLAILLVIIFHSVTILKRVDLPPPLWLKEIADFFGLYRMPTLMFLSGLLLPQSFGKGPKPYFSGKLRNVWWPYLIWSGIAAIILRRDVGSLSAILSLLNAGSYLWFLYFIGIFYIVAYFVKSFNFALIGAALFAISVVIAIAFPDARIAIRMSYLMAFFFFGGFAGRHWERFLALVDSKACLLAVAVAIVGGFAAAYFDLKSGPAFGVLASIFIIAACHLSRKVGNHLWANMPNFVGRNSLKFYVSHFPAIYLFDKIAVRLGFREVDLLVVVSICFALITGMVLSVASEKISLAKLLFAAPKISTASRARPASA